jgi:cephalosporin hydroxylase
MEHIYQEPQFGEDWFTYPNLYTRFVNEFGDGAKFVEVGCWKGKSVAYWAVEAINSGKKITIDAVDTWEGSEEIMDDEHVKNGTLYELFLSNISPLREVINPIRLSSVEASKRYEDNSLDVVFIDAAHDYENVSQDIKCWLPKVKQGGYIAGHDYFVLAYGVRKAVDEMFEKVELTEKCWVYKIGEQTNG